jgi:hypothetical protein
MVCHGEGACITITPLYMLVQPNDGETPAQLFERVHGGPSQGNVYWTANGQMLTTPGPDTEGPDGMAFAGSEKVNFYVVRSFATKVVESEGTRGQLFDELGGSEDTEELVLVRGGQVVPTDDSWRDQPTQPGDRVFLHGIGTSAAA